MGVQAAPRLGFMSDLDSCERLRMEVVCDRRAMSTDSRHRLVRPAC